MQCDIETDRARRCVLVWLRKKTGLSLEDLIPYDENQACEKNEEIAQLFFKIANPRGFSWSVLKSNQGYIVRWSHPRCNAGNIPNADARPRVQDACLLACAALLQHAECFAQLEGD
jgi:hypothetical protein